MSWQKMKMRIHYVTSTSVYFGIFHRIQRFSLLKMVILSTVKILIPTEQSISVL